MADYAYPKALTGMQDTQWSNFMAAILSDGAFTAAAFAPSANGSGMTVSLAPGEGIIRGILTGDASAASVTIPAAPAAGQSRIDTVVKRLDRSGTPVIKTVVLSGTASSTTPSAPALTQNPSGVWEWPVADVLVEGGATSIAAAKVTDRRSLSSKPVTSYFTRPAAPAPLALGFNRSTGKWEFHDGSTWRELVPAITAADLPTVPIAKGGTGATTSSDALKALGIFVQATDPGHADGRVWIKG
ncbi:hypothetical protein [Microbacterium sp.]|uniref:hypothetical protein n=1 Tax=Microbacterium sp. TaxID=51671 RepID=UPI0032420140